MRIQHNIMAMNAYRNYNTNTSALSKNLEKLSSGYKINRAGDDAAGLAISEKMRGQIAGLDAAQKNVKDGISLVKTAEGAMQEVQDMLKRMKYLATQSANGTYEQVDRDNLQMEVKQLKEEINRIGANANFNGIKLLNGKFDAGEVTLGGGGDTNNAATYLEATATWNGATVTGVDVAKVPAKDAVAAEYSFTAPTFNATNDASVTIAGVTMTIGAGNTNDLDTTGATGNADTAAKTASAIVDKLNADTTFKGKYTAEVDGTTNTKVIIKAKNVGVDTKPTITVTAQASQTATTAPTVAEDKKGAAAVAEVPAHKTYDLSGTPKAGDKVTIDGKEYTFDTNADGSDGKTFKDLATLKTAAAKNGVTLDTTTNTAVVATKAATPKQQADDDAGNGNKLVLQIGDSSGEQLGLSIGTISTTALGIDDLDVSAADTALAAIDTIRTATDYVSSVRGLLGAYQNRLEHTANNLSVMAENITDAESTIRDTDVAEEMMSYVKNNILVQSAQAMLAQANQVPQGVLQLLG